MFKKWLPGLIGLSALAVLGRLLGFAREVLMATKFGATEITDAYLTTLVLFDIAIAANSSIISGTLSYSTGIKDLAGFSKSLFRIGLKIFAVVIVISLLVYPLTGWITPMIFSKSVAAINIVVDTSRILLILAAFLVTAGVFSALLQINGDITNPGKLVVFLNVASIVFLIFFSKFLGIISLPLGLLLGGVLFFLYQFFLIEKIKLHPAQNYGEEKFNLIGWGTVIFLVFGNSLLPSLSGLLERYFAYHFVEGTFSYYQYSVKIILLPLSIFSFAISTSLLPIQAQSIGSGNEKEFMKITNNSLLVSVITSSFFVLIFSILSQPIIQIIYRHGHFTEHDSIETSRALQIMAFGLIPFLLNPVLANIFYSLKTIKSLIAINIVFICLEAVILFLLSKIFSGIETLAITWVIIMWMDNGALIYYLVQVKKLYFDTSIVSKILITLLITAALIFIGKVSMNMFFSEDELVHDNSTALIKIASAGFFLLLLFGMGMFWIFKDMLKKFVADLKQSRK